MAIVKGGILGGVKGRVGSIVGQSHKGLSVIRSEKGYKNAKSSELQEKQHSRMSITADYYKLFVGTWLMNNFKDSTNRITNTNVFWKRWMHNISKDGVVSVVNQSLFIGWLKAPINIRTGGIIPALKCRLLYCDNDYTTEYANGFRLHYVWLNTSNKTMVSYGESKVTQYNNRCYIYYGSSMPATGKSICYVFLYNATTGEFGNSAGISF